MNHSYTAADRRLPLTYYSDVEPGGAAAAVLGSHRLLLDF